MAGIEMVQSICLIGACFGCILMEMGTWVA